MLTALYIFTNITTILGAYLAVYASVKYVDYLKMKKFNNDKVEN